MPTLDQCYKLLGVDAFSSQEEIKRAYRKLAKKFHPDVNKAPTAARDFVAVQNAYEFLLKHHAPKKGKRPPPPPPPPPDFKGGVTLKRIFVGPFPYATDIPKGACETDDVLFVCLSMYGTFQFVLKKGTRFPCTIEVKNVAKDRYGNYMPFRIHIREYDAW